MYSFLLSNKVVLIILLFYCLAQRFKNKIIILLLNIIVIKYIYFQLIAILFHTLMTSLKSYTYFNISFCIYITQNNFHLFFHYHMHIILLNLILIYHIDQFRNYHCNLIFVMFLSYDLHFLF